MFVVWDFLIFFSAWLVSWILKPALLAQNKGALMMFKRIWRAAVCTKLCSAFLWGREEEASGGQESHGQMFAIETKSMKQSLKAKSPTGTLVIISTVAFPKLLIGFWMQVENTAQQGRVNVKESIWKVPAMCQHGGVAIIFMCSANPNCLPLGKVKA